jgi:hypothetical protein
MNMLHQSVAALLVASGLGNEPARATAVAAQDSAATAKPSAEKSDAFAAEYDALTKAFAGAQSAYYEPYTKAKSDEEREKVKLDPDLRPQKAFTPKFVDLAKRAEGTDTAIKAWMWIVRQGDGTSPQQAVEALTTRYIQSESLTDLASSLRHVNLAQRGQVASFLQLLIAQSPHKSVRAQATCSLAYVYLENADSKSPSRAEAHQLYEQVLSDYPDTKAAKQAEHALFEMDHLQIGMVAPDIEATDVDGNAFKLSDYRGKVVVLDFWGNW